MRINRSNGFKQLSGTLAHGGDRCHVSAKVDPYFFHRPLTPHLSPLTPVPNSIGPRLVTNDSTVLQ